jgi:phosphoglycolate phosphatase
MASPLLSARCPARGASIRHFITFDVDGTLIASTGSQNAVHKHSFTPALAAVFGIQGALISDIAYSGRTDSFIVTELCVHHGLPRASVTPEKLQAALQHMQQHCAERHSEVAAGLTVLPGVQELLAALAARGDCLLGLVTGNVQGIALQKLQACGLSPALFATGGFGSDHEDRGALISLALQRAREALPLLPPAEQLHITHIGDTPNDLQAACTAGCRGLGVASGDCSAEQLREAAAAAAAASSAAPGQLSILSSGLADLPAVLAALQLLPLPVQGSSLQ